MLANQVPSRCEYAAKVVALAFLKPLKGVLIDIALSFRTDRADPPKMTNERCKRSGIRKRPAPADRAAASRLFGLQVMCSSRKRSSSQNGRRRKMEKISEAARMSMASIRLGVTERLCRHFNFMRAFAERQDRLERQSYSSQPK